MRRRSNGNVIWINEYENTDTFEVLEAVAERFRNGTAFGMVIFLDQGVGQDGVEDHGIAVTGSYRDNPVQGRAIAGAAFDFFAKLARPFKRPGKL